MVAGEGAPNHTPLPCPAARRRGAAPGEDRTRAQREQEKRENPMLEHVGTIITVGLWLSVIALLVVAITVWNVWRRESFPEVAYGGVSLTPRRVRWLWTLALVGATVIGSARDPIIMNSVDMNDPDAEATAQARGDDGIRTTSMQVPLPFYRYEREDVTRAGLPVSSHELRGFVLPTPLLWTLLAYVFLVVRFNPDGRWTRRILHGRKATRAGDDASP